MFDYRLLVPFADLGASQELLLEGEQGSRMRSPQDSSHRTCYIEYRYYSRCVVWNCPAISSPASVLTNSLDDFTLSRWLFAVLFKSSAGWWWKMLLRFSIHWRRAVHGYALINGSSNAWLRETKKDRTVTDDGQSHFSADLKILRNILYPR